MNFILDLTQINKNKKLFLQKNMKPIIITAVLFMISFYLSSQNWDWANGEGGKGMERSWDISIDSENNVFAAGQFTDTLEIGETSIPCHGISDLFIVKYSGEGKLQWVNTFGGDGEDIALSIDTDSDGNCEWVVQGGGENSDIATDIAATENGCTVTGWYAGESQLGNIQLHAYNNSDVNIFLGQINQSVYTQNINYPKHKPKVVPNPSTEECILILNSKFTESVTGPMKIYNETGYQVFSANINTCNSSKNQYTKLECRCLLLFYKD